MPWWWRNGSRWLWRGWYSFWCRTLVLTFELGFLELFPQLFYLLPVPVEFVYIFWAVFYFRLWRGRYSFWNRTLILTLLTLEPGFSFK